MPQWIRIVTPFSLADAEIPDIQPDYNPRPDEPSLKSTFSDEYLANIVLPAVIIVVMIILASLVACCLHRRRHKSGKMELGRPPLITETTRDRILNLSFFRRRRGAQVLPSQGYSRHLPG